MPKFALGITGNEKIWKIGSTHPKIMAIVNIKVNLRPQFLGARIVQQSLIYLTECFVNILIKYIWLANHKGRIFGFWLDFTFMLSGPGTETLTLRE